MCIAYGEVVAGLLIVLSLEFRQLGFTFHHIGSKRNLRVDGHVLLFVLVFEIGRQPLALYPRLDIGRTTGCIDGIAFIIVIGYGNLAEPLDGFVPLTEAEVDYIENIDNLLKS